jgi:hypothetical protein
MPETAPPIRRTLARALVASLCFAAFVAVIALASGSFGDTDWRLISTSLSFAVYSALAASGAAVRLKEHAAAGALGSATVGAAAIGWTMLLVLIWAHVDSEALARFCGVATIAALAGSHASIVLRGARAADTPAISALATASIALGAFDAACGALAVSGAVDADEGSARFMAVMVVLLLLTTALPPILRRVGAPGAPPASPWVGRRNGSLERLAGEVVAATERIERLDDPAAVRVECRRLRDLARALGG